ncbi:hypothetical protein LSH36_10g04002 [Paralvinella palmiformis]|uniref:Beta-lactamase-related domain-containing protein n=1 Tax=Paralvinella palmiformis TaxID=53620 RepID=A0AAD9KEQ0_9ANNE|nr:hypothetical protein LSH36_10g04002 [Paralvinella palmiformis]
MHARAVERLLFVFVVAPLFHFIRYDYLLKAAGVALILLIIRWLKTRRRTRYHIGGYVAPGWEHVADVYKESLISREEQGSSFSVYHKGVPVVDLWGGYADPGALRYRQSDSVGLFYSTTKAVTAITLAVLADRGQLDYDAKVSSYWPEFGQEGKEDITVKTLLSHQAGVLAIREKHKLSLSRDNPSQLAKLLASQKPMFKPNSGVAYHTLTFGLYADQLVRRIDKKGRSLAQFFREEIGDKFNIDFYIGQPNHLHHRACRETRAEFGVWFLLSTLIPTTANFVIRMVYSLIRYRTIYLIHLIGNPTDWRPRRLNDPRFREIPCGSSHGVGTARGLAKLMGILANGGKHEGETLLSKETIDYLKKPIVTDFDRVILRNIAYGPGVAVNKVIEGRGKSHYIFGHWGAGGQMAYCDVHHQMGWAYNTNFNNILHGFIIDHRYEALQDAIYRCVRELASSNGRPSE